MHIFAWRIRLLWNSGYITASLGTLMNPPSDVTGGGILVNSATGSVGAVMGNHRNGKVFKRKTCLPFDSSLSECSVMCSGFFTRNAPSPGVTPASFSTVKTVAFLGGSLVGTNTFNAVL